MVLGGIAKTSSYFLFRSFCLIVARYTLILSEVYLKLRLSERLTELNIFMLSDGPNVKSHETKILTWIDVFP